MTLIVWGDSRAQLQGFFDLHIEKLYDLLDHQISELRRQHPTEHIVSSMVFFSYTPSCQSARVNTSNMKLIEILHFIRGAWEFTICENAPEGKI